MDILLDSEEARVLGALLEKARLTPDGYPLTLNSLVAACNQTTSRDPVVSYAESTVLAALERLRDKKLAAEVNPYGGRVPKYEERLTSQLFLKPPEHAVLCLLLLRGPQTLGELKARSGRLYDFADLAEVEATLTSLTEDRYPPRIVKLPRQAGTKESRYAHTLCGEVEAAREAPGRESPVRESGAERLQRLEDELAALRREFDEFKGRFE